MLEIPLSVLFCRKLLTDIFTAKIIKSPLYYSQFHKTIYVCIMLSSSCMDSVIRLFSCHIHDGPVLCTQHVFGCWVVTRAMLCISVFTLTVGGLYGY